MGRHRAGAGRSPERFLRPVPEQDAGICPFCQGNEGMTPPELLSRRENGAWSLRVVPNRYPALRTEIQMSRSGLGMFDSMAGVGAHEVVIETPDHRATLADLAAPQIEAVLRAWQDRMLDLSRDVRLKSRSLSRIRASRRAPPSPRAFAADRPALRSGRAGGGVAGGPRALRG